MILQDARSRAFQLLGDPVRWRLLRLLRRVPLRVAEATAIVGVAQSGISRHLGLLRGAGLVAESRRGGWAWYALVEAPPRGVEGLWPALLEELEASSDSHGDDARLAEVLRQRAEVGEEEGARGSEPGRSWAAWAHALAWLVPAQRVVHLGAGSGALSREVARFASPLLAVEPDEARAAEARQRLEALPQASVVCAPLARVPRPDASFDLALIVQSLAPVAEPRRVLEEALRLLAGGGRLVLLDLLPHDETWVEERLGHRRRGLEPALVRGWFEALGLEDVRVEGAERRRGNPFVVLLASGTKPRAGAPA